MEPNANHQDVDPDEPGTVDVLVVDDEEFVLEVLEDILTKEGYSVIACTNGSEALDVLQHVRPSLILLDIQMPIMDGAEFREVQRHDRDLLRIPTVVMTASNEEMQLDLAVVDTIHKPVRKRDLLGLVARYLHPTAPFARGEKPQDPVDA
jgi:CheY-like chemotaxis protein